MSIEGILEKGWVTTSADKLINWTRTGSMWRHMEPVRVQLMSLSAEVVTQPFSRIPSIDNLRL